MMIGINDHGIFNIHNSSYVKSYFLSTFYYLSYIFLLKLVNEYYAHYFIKLSYNFLYFVISFLSSFNILSLSILKSCGIIIYSLLWAFYK